ncbi:late 100Kd hexon transport protein [Odocoileus adenovirus 1]|uniref:Late 100 kDa hexon transport protein n=2 Tax=Deer atadenovirus A TaxID=2169706 RepID=A0A515MFT1_9ADEN|nr:late 100Kd hexon transport protein [Odocoileus adenovirus 1]QDM55326.1 late 100 Kda hexon transport protein [Deer atadenovirus A]ASU50480.1 late 100Kd hexon transport protein [Odocoileus adenovirus 1]ASU50507.1 late 100Kd hexon transport protein [Odocoileus adenovirus 1]ASU50645.1 late 100Kd hexon transport protein [Odocoileus adenovirus 1]QEM20943.1 Late 100Kd hexon transport protein [Deer atadenovirus A]
MAEKNIEESEKGDLAENYVDTILSKHLERQIKICKGINTNISDLNIASAFENLIFCPKDRRFNGDPDPKMNFYPPFLIPECLALHYPFFLSIGLPKSCKANNIGSPSYPKWLKKSTLSSEIPDVEKCKWDDSLGKVDLIEELQPNQKLIRVQQDSQRLMWCKEKAKNLIYFSYPSLSLPPNLHKILIESFIGKSQDPNQLEKTYEPAITVEKLKNLKITGNIQEIQNRLSMAISYGVLIECITKLFSEKQFIMHCQESLHYTFNHGFVKLIQLLTDVNLSEFVTFHGLTHRNRLNNPFQHTQLSDEDKVDYVLDTIYLFLVLTWQTAMDIWNQTLDEKTIEQIKEHLDNKSVSIITATSCQNAAQIIANIIFPQILLDAFSANLPDFINQSQITNFRNFICIKSGIPQSICPLLPSDLVPLEFTESHPILWSHVLMLKYATFLMNHGNYLNHPEKPYTISSSYCECNLCSPHRMPCYNSNLLNEILSIGKFEFQSESNDKDKKSFKLTPQAFANAYLSKIPLKDFFYDKTIFYKDNKEEFSHQLTACIIKDEKLLATITEMQVRREKELLKRGAGVYLDPETGEQLNQSVNEDGKTLSTLNYHETQRERNGYDVPPPTPETRESRWRASQRRRRRSK